MLTIADIADVPADFLRNALITLLGLGGVVFG